ncbi:MAG: peptidoglycan-binding protein [Verrucomicrobia bacterium]|nr:peptidoglycan-binding protein [Verrucomicrobiota bacterium]
MRFFSLFAAAILFATGLSAQTRAQAPRLLAVQPRLIQRPVGGVHLSPVAPSSFNNAGLGVPGLPAGPSRLSYPLASTPANDAWVRNNAWAAYRTKLNNIANAVNPNSVDPVNPNRLAGGQNLVDQDRFVEKPNSVDRYNFQFSDNEIRSVQAALRRLGIYSGQVDGVLGPDTRRAINDYQIRNNLPITGQPDQGLNASLGIF